MSSSWPAQPRSGGLLLFVAVVFNFVLGCFVGWGTAEWHRRQTAPSGKPIRKKEKVPPVASPSPPPSIRPSRVLSATAEPATAPHPGKEAALRPGFFARLANTLSFSREPQHPLVSPHVPQPQVPIESIPHLLPWGLLYKYLLPCLPLDAFPSLPSSPLPPRLPDWLLNWHTAFHPYAWRLLDEDDEADRNAVTALKEFQAKCEERGGSSTETVIELGSTRTKLEYLQLRIADRMLRLYALHAFINLFDGYPVTCLAEDLKVRQPDSERPVLGEVWPLYLPFPVDRTSPSTHLTRGCDLQPFTLPDFPCNASGSEAYSRLFGCPYDQSSPLPLSLLRKQDPTYSSGSANTSPAAPASLAGSGSSAVSSSYSCGTVRHRLTRLATEDANRPRESSRAV